MRALTACHVTGVIFVLRRKMDNLCQAVIAITISNFIRVFALLTTSDEQFITADSIDAILRNVDEMR